MDLFGARVLLISDDNDRLEVLRGHLSKAGAIPNTISPSSGLAAAAEASDVVVLFDDAVAPNAFAAGLATLARSNAPLLVVTDRARSDIQLTKAGVVFTPTRLVRGWALLDAIRARICAVTPELPFTD